MRLMSNLLWLMKQMFKHTSQYSFARTHTETDGLTYCKYCWNENRFWFWRNCKKVTTQIKPVTLTECIWVAFAFNLWIMSFELHVKLLNIRQNISFDRYRAFSFNNKIWIVFSSCIKRLIRLFIYLFHYTNLTLVRGI